MNSNLTSIKIYSNSIETNLNLDLQKNNDCDAVLFDECSTSLVPQYGGANSEIRLIAPNDQIDYAVVLLKRNKVNKITKSPQYDSDNVIKKYIPSDTDHTLGNSNRVQIKHSNNSIARYKHLKYNCAVVFKDDSMDYGDTFGLCGILTRFGNIPHLHFEVFRTITYKYSDAIPVSYNNLKGKLTKTNFLITGEYYLAE